MWIKNLLPTVRKSIENRSQIGLESEFVSKSLSKSILERFRVDFGSNFGSQMGEVLLSGRGLGAFPIPNWTWKAFWTPFGAILEAFWKHFQWIFCTLGPILRPFWAPKLVPNGTAHRHANETSNVTLFTFNFHLVRRCFNHWWYPIFFQKYCVFT